MAFYMDARKIGVHAFLEFTGFPMSSWLPVAKHIAMDSTLPRRIDMAGGPWHCMDINATTSPRSWGASTVSS